MPRRSRKKTQVELNVADHRHCEVCGKVIPRVKNTALQSVRRRLLKRDRAWRGLGRYG